MRHLLIPCIAAIAALLVGTPASSSDYSPIYMTNATAHCAWVTVDEERFPGTDSWFNVRAEFVKPHSRHKFMINEKSVKVRAQVSKNTTCAMPFIADTWDLYKTYRTPVAFANLHNTNGVFRIWFEPREADTGP
jgi:hypothetical protein